MSDLNFLENRSRWPVGALRSSSGAARIRPTRLGAAACSRSRQVISSAGHFERQLHTLAGCQRGLYCYRRSTDAAAAAAAEKQISVVVVVIGGMNRIV